MIKICAISDCHGYLPELEPCDLVLICGDICPLNVQRSNSKTLKWFRNTFKEWSEKLPCNKVVFIGGNHDFGLSNQRHLYRDLFTKNEKVTYLCNELYVYKAEDGKEYSIFGTPYCKIFYAWAFMLPYEDLKIIYNEIPNDVDILITHDAPFGVSDVLLQHGYYTGEHIGNPALREAILEKNPKICFHGHLHSTSREFELLGNTKVTNCSLKDEHYNVVYSPIYLEYGE